MSSFFEFQQRLLDQRRAPTPAPAANAEPVTVSELTQQIDKAIKSGVPASVLVKGEISNFHRHSSSGHLYFTLKDPDACIDCVMFRVEAASLIFEPEDGMELMAQGRVGVFAQRGRYQLYVTQLQPLGRGALEVAYQQLYARLSAEGLFEDDRKKLLPRYPLCIGLVTSVETAALQDMLKVLRRFPWLRLCIYHVPVQGDGSAEKIAAAIHHLNRKHACLGDGIDVILLARGGGSLEDLWEFNEEVVARAVAASRIPIVTGIGHEVDTSIADLVADYHAHTPTEAAQVVVMHWRGVAEMLTGVRERLDRGTRIHLQDVRRRLASIERHEFFRRPLDQVNQLQQLVDDRQRALSLAISECLRNHQRNLHLLGARLDQHRPAVTIGRCREKLRILEQRLTRSMASRLHQCSQKVSAIAQELGECHPRHRIRLNQQRLDSLASRLTTAALNACRQSGQRVESIRRQLEALSPEQVLRRGYSITLLKKQNRLVRSPADVKPGDKLVTRLADGEIESTAQDPAQPGLFE